LKFLATPLAATDLKLGDEFDLTFLPFYLRMYCSGERIIPCLHDEANLDHTSCTRI